MTLSFDPLIDKAARDCGFDLGPMVESDSWLGYRTTQAPLEIWLRAAPGAIAVALSRSDVAGHIEEDGLALADSRLPAGAASALSVPDIAALYRLLRRAFQLARSLPTAPLEEFKAATRNVPSKTEAERLVVQRIGQHIYRKGLMEYWQGRCAITGLALPALLRASHAKPWALCDTDAERLDVFNGLLLAAHLDAAFDAGLISVAEDGAILVSPSLDATACELLALSHSRRIDDLAPEHRPYLEWHRRHIWIST